MSKKNTRNISKTERLLDELMAELSILPNEDDKVVPVKVDHVDVVCSYCAKVILDNDSKLFKCPHLVAM